MVLTVRLFYAVKKTNLEIVQEIKNVAKIYKEKMLGKVFLYIYDKGFLEISFRKRDFPHLTGVIKKISAEKFFDLAVSRKLTEQQFYFSKEHPRDLCVKKVFELSNLPKMTESEGFILEDIKTQSVTFKFGFTDLHFTLCLREDLDDSGVKKSDYYLPQSFRVENSFSKSSNVYEIHAILEKKNSDKKYNVLKYSDGSNIHLSDELKSKIDEAILNLV